MLGLYYLLPAIQSFKKTRHGCVHITSTKQCSKKQRWKLPSYEHFQPATTANINCCYWTVATRGCCLCEHVVVHRRSPKHRCPTMRGHWLPVLLVWEFQVFTNYFYFFFANKQSTDCSQEYLRIFFYFLATSTNQQAMEDCNGGLFTSKILHVLKDRNQQRNLIKKKQAAMLTTHELFATVSRAVSEDAHSSFAHEQTPQMGSLFSVHKKHGTCEGSLMFARLS